MAPSVENNSGGTLENEQPVLYDMHQLYITTRITKLSIATTRKTSEMFCGRTTKNTENR